jgi:hypothetical protein
VGLGLPSMLDLLLLVGHRDAQASPDIHCTTASERVSRCCKAAEAPCRCRQHLSDPSFIVAKHKGCTSVSRSVQAYQVQAYCSKITLWTLHLQAHCRMRHVIEVQEQPE